MTLGEHAAADYESLLSELKQRIRDAQLSASLAVNRELIVLYWQIGRDIVARQHSQGWGAQIVMRLADDLHRAFPDVKGLSRRNLQYMHALDEAYPDAQIVQRVVAQIPWGHNVRLLDGVKSPEERIWYLRQTIEHGWSRNVLVCLVASLPPRFRGNLPTVEEYAAELGAGPWYRDREDA